MEECRFMIHPRQPGKADAIDRALIDNPAAGLIVIKNARLRFPDHPIMPTKPAAFCNGKIRFEMSECTFQNKKALRQIRQIAKQQRAEYGWFNWYVNRGRMTLSRDPKVIEREMRSKSWRRAL